MRPGSPSRAALVAAAIAATGAACRGPNPAYHPPGASPADAGPRIDAAAPRPPPDAPPAAPDAPRERPLGPEAGPIPDARPPDARPPAITCPVDPDLALCLRFENSVKDESSTRMTFETAALAFEPGPDGLALDAGVQTRIQNTTTRALDVTTGLTIEGWVKPRTLPAAGQRGGILDYQPQYSLFVTPGGGIYCAVGTDRSFTVDNLLTAGVWAAVACTANDTTLTIWIDGVAKGTRPIDHIAMPYDPGLAVAGNATSAGVRTTPDPFEGAVDNVRVWRRVRTQTELCRSAVRCP